MVRQIRTKFDKELEYADYCVVCHNWCGDSVDGETQKILREALQAADNFATLLD